LEVIKSVESLNKIKKIASLDYNSLLDSYKKRGIRIMGYFCSYIPEELIHAAGFIPYRMRAVNTQGTSKGDIYFSSLNCTFVRNCFDKAARGDFDFLDGIVFMNGCDHNRRIYDNWRYAGFKPDYRHMFVTPHVITKSSLKRYADEINKFKLSLESYYDIEITEKKIKNSITLYNRKRELLSDIHKSRMFQEVPVKGSEMLAIMLAVTSIPVEEAITILEKLKEDIQGRVVNSRRDLRIYLTSGHVEETRHLEIIENAGSVIVADNICLGSRYADGLIKNTSAPIESIAAGYLNKISCARMMNDTKNRLAFLQQSVKDYSIDAVIIEKLKFCDIWGGEMFILRKELKKQFFPVLALERELYGDDRGQLKTRVQAFFEQVRNKEASDDNLMRIAGNDYRIHN